jgi:hypothetical protein
MARQYKRIDRQSLESEILIEIRKYHVNEISKQFVKQNIVSKEYLDRLIKIENLRKNILDEPDRYNNRYNDRYNDEKRIEILNSLLQKECEKNTASFIASLTRDIKTIT